MELWWQRFHRSGGSISCRSNCPVHMSCTGAIRPLSASQTSTSTAINGHQPLAQCDTCAALFGFEHAALHFLEHPAEWRQSSHDGKPLGIP